MDSYRWLKIVARVHVKQKWGHNSYLTYYSLFDLSEFVFKSSKIKVRLSSLEVVIATHRFRWGDSIDCWSLDVFFVSHGATRQPTHGQTLSTSSFILILDLRGVCFGRSKLLVSIWNSRDFRERYKKLYPLLLSRLSRSHDNGTKIRSQGRDPLF